ncbi:Hypothetical predicted protein [Pelobates cultripes]|uniref:Uncharacterized protein n=1 Tax=Pelobates cultripes TaxID=61616 RepID=A0AAD1SHA7_PELCU|nr:Hypothetical predicted protein [Pelobates cultripes]
MKRLPTQTAKTLRTTPKGPTLGHNGSQAHGLQAPAHTRSRGRGENPPARHHGSTQQQRTSKGNHKHVIKLKMGGRQANSGAAVPQEQAGSRYSTTRHICVATHPHRRHPQISPGHTAQLLYGLDPKGDWHWTQNSGGERSDTTPGQRMDYLTKVAHQWHRMKGCGYLHSDHQPDPNAEPDAYPH